MKLVMLTNTYPYGDQEAFIEPEMKVMEKIFDEIHILTLASTDAFATHYIPTNAKVTLVRQGKNKRIWKTLFRLLTPSAWKEIHFATRKFQYSLRTSIMLFLRFYGNISDYFMDYLELEDVDNTIFYSYWLSHLSYALACFKEKHPNAFCISRAHRVDNFVDFKASLFRREILSQLDGVYPISLEGKNEIERRILPFIGKKHADLKVFHLGVDFSDIVNPVKNYEEMQIVSCSFIHKIKRLDIVIDALAKIDDIPIHWTHFGGGQDEEMIRQMALSKLGNKGNIRFDLCGQTAHSDVLNYYKQNHVDLFVNTSDHEGIPVSIMEAMAAGIICAARDVGGNCELISNRENGFLLEKNAGAQEYAELLRQVYNNRDAKLDVKKQNAMQTVRARFASPAVYEEFARHLLCLYDQARQSKGDIK